MTTFTKGTRRSAAALISAAAIVLRGGEAVAADAQPRDFLPAPAGTQLGLLYYLNSSSNTFVDSHGNNVPGSSLDTNIGIARYVYFFDIGTMRTDFNVVQPFGGLSNMSIGGAKFATDDFTLGDTTFVATIWPLNDPKNNRYFAVATYLTLPTGKYDPNVASLGSNRWSVTVQPAYYFNIAPKWSVDLVGDVTFYGNNDNGPGGLTIEKAPNYTALGWLNYHASDITTISFGITTTYGGEEKWGGVSRGDIKSTTVRGAWLQMLDPTTQLVTEFGGDVDANNTFKRNLEVVVRIAKFF